ncbi:hypothetical protein [Cohnella rhizosphaerae]|uniref:Uncharacterized protein n=1 Tax=Cohnella rhizosphaerae TaxID=1457232 RepID=A0A9X4L3T4_9BACL|nr:hypothetical protein [Cohnella rhizosphaerae]MDG0812962.1 hypothetical protein [Cohnella rhizosphaerae]
MPFFEHVVDALDDAERALDGGDRLSDRAGPVADRARIADVARTVDDARVVDEPRAAFDHLRPGSGRVDDAFRHIHLGLLGVFDRADRFFHGDEAAYAGHGEFERIGADVQVALLVLERFLLVLGALDALQVVDRVLELLGLGAGHEGAQLFETIRRLDAFFRSFLRLGIGTDRG